MGGQYKWSGLRTKNAFYLKKNKAGKLVKKPIGAEMSQHRFGRAADLKFKNITPEEIRKAIKSDRKFWGEYINCVENKTGTWLHIDVRNCKPIKFINP